MPVPAAALALLLRADAESWGWSLATLPRLAGRLGASQPVPTEAGHLMRLPDGAELLVVLDREGRPERLSQPLGAALGDLTRIVGARLGPYHTARRGETVRRWWPLPSGRRLEAAATDPPPRVRSVTLELVRVGVPPTPWVPPDVLSDAAADCAARIAEAGYVPVEDESLPDMAAALGGRLSWSSPVAHRRQISLPQPPFHLELTAPVILESGLTWYSEICFDLFGSGDVPGSSRAVAYRVLVGAVTRRCGEATRSGPEACFWLRGNGWTVAADRSSGVVRLRVRPPDAAPVRPPD